MVVGVSFVGNPHEPRGGTCAPGVRRAACLSEGPACSTGWALFGVSSLWVWKLLRNAFGCRLTWILEAFRELRLNRILEAFRESSSLVLQTTAPIARTIAIILHNYGDHVAL